MRRSKGQSRILICAAAFAIILLAGYGSFCGLENFRNVLQNQAFRLVVKNTGAFLLLGVPLLLALSLAAALFLQKCGKSGDWLKTGFLVPMAIPAASAALLWRFLFHDQGLLNGLLQAAGLAGMDWMNTDAAFWEAWLVAGEYPHESMYLIQHLFHNWFRDLSLEKMAAGAVLDSVVLLLFILLLQKFWDREK
ncbi:MAG: sugar ABC transporter permease [Firmicutes bacterium]|nr:sugar ABC transporter permease [Bacillota bacterium]